MPDAELYEIAERYRPEFPVFQSATYLNSCSLGALSRRGETALNEFMRLWSQWGASAWYEHWLNAARELRTRFAHLIGVDEAETALAPSVSGALAAITSGIDFSRRNRVITTELDFPTLVYHFLARRPHGVETVVLSSPDSVSVPLEAFERAIDERTALVATSHVYFTSGAIQNVEAVARLAHEHGALCLVDAYQSTGQIPVDARQLGVDVLVTGSLKWLLGGAGLAYVYVSGSVLANLSPTVVGWFGVEDQFAMDPRALRLRGDARRFELGTPAVPTIYTGRSGLELVEEVGIERIHRRVAALTEDLRERAAGAGLRVRGASDPERRSGIVMVEHPRSAEAVRELLATGVIADHRRGAVRFSPHFYNTTDDNEKAVRALAG